MLQFVRISKPVLVDASRRDFYSMSSVLEYEKQYPQKENDKTEGFGLALCTFLMMMMPSSATITKCSRRHRIQLLRLQ